MRVTSESFEDGGPIPPAFALARSAEPGPVELSDNHNPHLAWFDAPEGTASFVVTCIDPDAPTSADDVNQPDREVPSDLPRADFVHWLLADVPAHIQEVAPGTHSNEVTKGGKSGTKAPIGVHGVNDYTGWFAGDPDMGGTWCGYDGPAPPWNDSIRHRYVFTVYALDIETLDLGPQFGRADLVSAMEGHVLDHASITGTYTSNKRLHDET